MKRVTAIGGIFFKSRDPQALSDWYEKHLGMKSRFPAPVQFDWRDAEDPSQKGYTVWAPFPADTTYFEPSHASFMVNFRVENIDAVLDALRKEGVSIDPKREDSPYGRFAWVMDPEGNRIELWEPPPEKKIQKARKPAKRPGKRKKSPRKKRP
ncbi:MAG: VOC family protein [Acidobacteriota bacterium]|nr:VOC family protein [Acidobacteriota bacterium]